MVQAKVARLEVHDLVVEVALKEGDRFLVQASHGVKDSTVADRSSVDLPEEGSMFQRVEKRLEVDPRVLLPLVLLVKVEVADPR